MHIEDPEDKKAVASSPSRSSSVRGSTLIETAHAGQAP